MTQHEWFVPTQLQTGRPTGKAHATLADGPTKYMCGMAMYAHDRPIDQFTVVMDRCRRCVRKIQQRLPCPTCNDTGYVDANTCPNIERSPCRDMGCGHDCPTCLGGQ